MAAPFIHRKAGIAGYSEDVGGYLPACSLTPAVQTAAGPYIHKRIFPRSGIPQAQGEISGRCGTGWPTGIKNPAEGQAVRTVVVQYLGGPRSAVFVNTTGNRSADFFFPGLSRAGAR